MKKLIPLTLLFLVACKATPIIVDENNPKGYIITNQDMPEVSMKINILWFSIWLVSVVGLALYTYILNKDTKE